VPAALITIVSLRRICYLFTNMEGFPKEKPGQFPPTTNLQQLSEFAALQGFAADAYIPGRYAHVHHLLNIGTNRMHIEQITGLDPIELDELEEEIAGSLWSRLPEGVRQSEEVATFFTSRLTEEQWLAGVDQSWLTKGNVSPRKLRLRHMDGQLKEHGIEPRNLLADDIFCATTYPYFVAGLNMGTGKHVSKATYGIQDELIGRLTAAAPNVFGSSHEQPEPPAPADPSGRWRKGERRALLPLIDRRLAATRTDPAPLLGPKGLAMYRAMAGTDVALGHYAEQHDQSPSNPTVMLRYIIDRIVERVPPETLQLHRLRRASALTLLGITYEKLPIEYTKRLFHDSRPSTLDTLGDRLAHDVTADTPWIHGEMQQVICDLPSAFEAADRLPEEVLSPRLMTVYRACVELGNKRGTLVRHLNRGKSSINSSMKSILERVIEDLSAEKVGLLNRRRQARTRILIEESDTDSQSVEKSDDT
jgi:hypothetical protein